MSFRLKIYILATFFLGMISRSNAQEIKVPVEWNRHAVKLSYSDGITLGISSALETGFGEVFPPLEREDPQSSGVFGIGYRYAITHKINVGIDLGFSTLTVIRLTANRQPAIREKEMNFLLLPAFNFIYFQKKMMQLYGQVNVGVIFNRYYETGLSETGKNKIRKGSAFTQRTAYQVSPIGLRVGNQHLGGFLEAGLGTRGFITIGITLDC